MSMSLAALLASPSSSTVTIGTQQPNSRRHSSSSTSHHYHPPPTMSPPVPYLSIGIDRRANSHHPATQVCPLVSPQHPNADNDGVLENGSPVPFNSSSSFSSPTTSSPLERALDQTPPLTALLQVLEREQLQEIHAKGGFAGFTAQEIEGWVAADRA